ncbi:HAD family phosphatase [Sanguibacter sp. HDW7]|uniref:HAD family hydrolase n=1 Tax=Sanguibacter sp. HDW7 TaxID=2714931 RepID=UPI00140E56E7|nr:HAD-IB family hydrolase [Sanguibacter sp. HDW7]QIK82574.1 HAD-IB family hydrolase [Sanguibacter sp. HDW7]
MARTEPPSSADVPPVPGEDPRGVVPEAPAPGSVVAAFFDVDNTIIRGASSFHLAIGLYKREFFRVRDIVFASMQQMRYLAVGENNEQIGTVRDRALLLIKGHSVAEVTAVGEEVYEQALVSRIFPGTRKILDAHLAAGHEVWLVTAAPIEIGALIAQRLGTTGALGSIAEHVDGVYTGRLVGELMHRESKADGVLALAEKRGIDLAASYAYGDSANDIPLLSTVGFPCAINPEPRLRRFARERGWPMREFRGKRRIAKRSLKTASWAGAAWVLGLVARSLTRTVRGR